MNLIISVFASILIAIVSGTDGENISAWEGGSSVIYAEVTGVENVSGCCDYVVELLPLATLTGKYDAALDGKVAATVNITPELYPEASAINEVPKKGTKVLVHTSKPMRGSKASSINNGPVMFMPENRGIIEVTGFDDPKVAETIEKLRKLREKHREFAEKKNAAAMPAAKSKQ